MGVGESVAIVLEAFKAVEVRDGKFAARRCSTSTRSLLRGSWPRPKSKPGDARADFRMEQTGAGLDRQNLRHPECSEGGMTTTPTRWRRWGGVSGVALAVLWAPMGVVVWQLPDLSSAAEIERFYRGHAALLTVALGQASVGFF